MCKTKLELYLNLAEELRTIAGNMKDAQARESLLWCAEDYDRRAWQEELKEKLATTQQLFPR